MQPRPSFHFACPKARLEYQVPLIRVFIAFSVFYVLFDLWSFLRAHTDWGSSINTVFVMILIFRCRMKYQSVSIIAEKLLIQLDGLWDYLKFQGCSRDFRSIFNFSPQNQVLNFSILTLNQVFKTRDQINDRCVQILKGFQNIGFKLNGHLSDHTLETLI